MPTVLITGGAGFIGSHLADALLGSGCYQVVVVDNFDLFYPRHIKESNIARHQGRPDYRFFEADLLERERLDEILHEARPDIIVHLAAKAGVRPSIADPLSYLETNVTGTGILLEAVVRHGVPRVIFGSSSSVYGVNEKVPFAEDDPTLNPISPYAATKIAGEALCRSFAEAYGLSVQALRFFTVYGPRQRPDLAISTFARKILAGEPIVVFGDGTSERDYTYVGDIVQGIIQVIERPHQGYEVYNLGNSTPTMLKDLILLVEETFQRKAIINREPVQTGDVSRTWADLSKSRRCLGYEPKISMGQGLALFRDWLLDHGYE